MLKYTGHKMEKNMKDKGTSDGNLKTLDLMHVPWYNTDEWKQVYNQLFDTDVTKRDLKKALNTLASWKHRMPRLYSLIEGTFILVYCFTMIDEDCSDDAIVLSSAILRFLNVCLCSSKSQQTFFHVAKTKNIPEWIVDIRHNFAHSQNLSSKEMLIRALHFLYNWIQKKYWDQQVKTLRDYINPPIIVFNKLLDLYERVVELGDKDYSAIKIRRLLSKNNIRFNRCKYVILQRIALEMSVQPLNTSIVPNVIIKNNNFLNAAEISNDGFIDRKNQYCWIPLIYSLIEWNIFYKFLKMLIIICCKNKDVNEAKKSAAWIKSICNVIKTDKTTTFLTLTNDQLSFQNFVFWTTSQPNVYMRKYIKELLSLGSFSDDYIFFTCQAAEALIPQPKSKRPKKIYTVECLSESFIKQLYEDTTNNKLEKNGLTAAPDAHTFDSIPVGHKPNF